MIYKSENLIYLQNIIDKIKTKTFSIETQYKFLKISKIIKSEIAILEEQKHLLVEQYGEKDDDQNYITKNGAIKIREDSVNECARKVRELNEMEISFPDIYFSLNELDSIGLTLEDLMYLDPFIKN